MIKTMIKMQILLRLPRAMNARNFAQDGSDPTRPMTVAMPEILVYNYAPHQSEKCPL
jgi:hypothetical protein